MLNKIEMDIYSISLNVYNLHKVPVCDRLGNRYYDFY